MVPSRAALALAILLASPVALAQSKPTRLPPPPPPHVGRTQTTSAAAPRERIESSDAPVGWDEGAWFVAPMLGMATDDLNLGIGVRGGKMITDRFSLGAAFVYQFGQSESGGTTVAAPTTTVNATYSASYSLFYLGPEAAYDFPIAPVIVRPYAGLGLASISTSATGGGVTVGASDTKLVIWPGCQVIYDVAGTNWFLGGDARLVTVPGGPSLGVFAMGGAKL